MGLSTLDASHRRRRLAAARPDVPMWPLSPLIGAVRQAGQAPAFTLLGLVAATEVVGTEALDGLEPPVLFVANHTSHLDTPTLLRALPDPWRRRVVVAAAADYFFTRPLLGGGAALLCNAFPFSRGTGARATLEQCAWLLEQGWSLLIFPEGTRSVTGQMGHFKAGAGLLAVALGIPVVPIYVDGLARILPKGRCLPSPGRVTVRLGPPLRFDATITAHAAAAAIEAAVHALAPEEQVPVERRWPAAPSRSGPSLGRGI